MIGIRECVFRLRDGLARTHGGFILVRAPLDELTTLRPEVLY
jgi:hypothetical protein